MKFVFTREKIWILLVAFTLCSFAFSERINSWGIIGLSVFFLADRHFIKKIKQPFSLHKLLPFLGFFAIYLVFFLFSEKDADASHALISKLSFVLLPLVFHYESYFTKQNTNRLLTYFSIALCIAFAYELGMSVYKNFIVRGTSLEYVLGRMQISDAIMHPGYQSNFFMLAIIWHFFNQHKYKYFFIGLFSIALLLLISRIVLLFYGFFLAFWAIRVTLRAANPIKTGAIIASLALLALFLLWQLPTVQSRVYSTLAQTPTSKNSIKYSDATSSRVVAYGQEIILIKENPIKGYGLGNAVEVLQKKLHDAGYETLAVHMHCHNQYFNTWLQTGIIGVLWLIGMLLFLLYYFYLQKDWVPFWFTILVALYLLTDDMLEIQAGIVFFVLIWSLYITKPAQPKHS